MGLSNFYPVRTNLGADLITAVGTFYFVASGSSSQMVTSVPHGLNTGVGGAARTPVWYDILPAGGTYGFWSGVWGETAPPDGTYFYIGVGNPGGTIAAGTYDFRWIAMG